MLHKTHLSTSEPVPTVASRQGIWNEAFLNYLRIFVPAGQGMVVENLPSMGLISSPHPHTKIVPVVVVVLFLRFMNTMISGVCNALSHVS